MPTTRRSALGGVGATGINALATLGPQVVALFYLGPDAFGRFSLVYLVYALGASIMLSVVCEAAARRVRKGGERSGRDAYLGAVLWVSIFAGVGAALLSLVLLPEAWLAAVVVVGVGCAVYRVGARFREIEESAWGIAVRADVCGLVGLVGGVFLFGRLVAPLSALVLAWALGGSLACLAGYRTSLALPGALTTWCGDHRSEIGPLLRESLVMDLSSIGAPYLIAPVLGAAQFGIYRAVSNVAAPVRLVLNPLRPKLAQMDVRSIYSKRTLAPAVGGAVILGTGAWGALVVIGRLDLTAGVITSLAPYAVACGLFVVSSFVGHLLYLGARTHATPGMLWSGRIAQSGFALVVPVAAAWVGGLSWAIWGYVVATIIGAVVWALVAHRIMRVQG